MKNAWKALASVTVAAALVIAPLVATGASAEEVASPDDTTIVEESVSEAPPPAAKPEPAGAPGAAVPAPAPVAAPESLAAPAPIAALVQTTGGDEQPKMVWVCKYVGTPGVNERLKDGKNPTDVSVSTLKDFPGTFPWGFPDAQEHSIAVGYSVFGYTPVCPPPAPDEPEPLTISPNTPVVKDLCETENDHYDLPASTTRISYTRDGRDIIATITADNTVWGLLAEGWVNEGDGVARFAFTPASFTDEDCEVAPPPLTFPVPTTFNAEPVGPTCDADGMFPDLGGEFLVQRGNTQFYSFAGDTVRLAVTRQGLTVDLYVFATDDKTILTGLSSAWSLNPDGRSAIRTITLAERIEISRECPTTFPVPAQFNAEPTPPTCDVAGTFSTDFPGAEFLVENNGVRYYALAGGRVRLSVDRVTPGQVNLYLFSPEGDALLTGLDPVTWLINEDGRSATRTITLGERLSDSVACPVTVTPPVVTPPVVTPPVVTPPVVTTTSPVVTTTSTSKPTGSLAVTGGPDMAPWGIGAAALMLAGAALMVFRKVVRH